VFQSLEEESMRNVLAVLLVFAVASVAQAQEAAFGAVEAVPSSVVEAPAPTVVTTSAPQANSLEIRTAVQATERAVAGDVVAADPTQRGSFWWYVAILVVAAVIVAVVVN
jgi:hypothetical protein